MITKPTTAKKIAKKRFVSFNNQIENYISNDEDTVEYFLERKSRVSALKKALSDLSDDERQMIRECFYFDGKKKPSYKVLAQSCGITRQAYCKRLNKLLVKLKPMVEYYLENS